MARKIAIAILSLGTLFFCTMIAYQFINSGFEFESINVRFVLAAFVGIVSLSRMFAGSRRPRISKDALEKAYADIIGTAFSNNNNDEGYALLLKALSFYNADKYKKAISSLKKLYQKCESNSEMAIVSFFLGLCYDDLNQLALARESYESALRKDSTLDVAYNNLGLIYRKSGDFKAAVQLYEKAIAANRKNAFAYNNLATVYIDMLEADKAIEYALKALELKANMYQAMNTLALAYSMKNEDAMAEDYYQKSVVNGSPNPEALRILMQRISAENAQET